MKRPAALKWTFAPRPRPHAFGWRSQPALQRVGEGGAEIQKVARKDPALAAAGAVQFLEKVSLALKQVDKQRDEMNTHNRHLEAKGIRISQLLNMFSNELQRPVVDHTGLTGFYDVDLRWRRDTELSSNNTVDSDAPPLLPEAIQEQLGLKLRSSKQTVPVLVIDRLTPPTAD